MLSVYIEAPFAACRTFTAGWFRPTATFLTPSAAYGLLLNVARIETRLREEDEGHPGTVPASLMRAGLPGMRMAIGAPARKRIGRRFVDVPESERFPSVQTVFQQLHNYPVGASGGDRAATAFGGKYNIAPVRRELLVGLRTVIKIESSPDIEDRIRRGLAGELSDDRYGLPFLGDNSLLLDRAEVLEEALPAYWYERLATEDSKMRPRTTRLTTWINRGDLSQTRSELFAPTTVPTTVVSENAWVVIDPL